MSVQSDWTKVQLGTDGSLLDPSPRDFGFRCPVVLP
jgi:hypothetical protein